MRRLVPVLLAAAVTTADARVIIQITACGAVIERGQVGILMADLDCGDQWGSCSSCVPGGESCTHIEPAVLCSGRSDCPDPGTDKCDGARVPWSVGVYLPPGGRLYLNGHSIRHAKAGVLGTDRDGVATGGARSRVIGPGSIGSTREAIYAGKLQVSGGVTLGDSLYGVSGSTIRLQDVDASDNVTGVSAFDVLRATRVTADDNLYAGLLSYARARIRASHATGNGVADITAEDPPQVAQTVCDHSAALEETGTPGVYSATGPPFGVCRGD